MAKKAKRTKAQVVSSEKKRKVSHKGARAKGHQFEREIANQLRHIFPDIQRKLEYRASDIDGADLENFGPYAAQLKNHQAYAPINTLRREVKSTADKIPLLITKGARAPTVVVMYFNDFVNMLEQICTTEINNKTLEHWDEEGAERMIEAKNHMKLLEGEPIPEDTPVAYKGLEDIVIDHQQEPEDFI